MEASNDNSDRQQARWQQRCDELSAAHRAACAELEALRGTIDGLQVVHARDASELAALGESLLALQDEAARLGARLAEASQHLAEARAKARLLAGSMSFRLGYAIVTSLKSPRRLLQLPARLWRLRTPARDDGAEELLASLSVQTPEPAPDAPVAGVQAAHTVARPAPTVLRDLRIAAIMDDFTRACLEPTCHVQSLHASRYESQLLACDPHLLLVESAWRGDAGSWRNKIASGAGELRGLLDMCRRRGIPTAFWNKEDPSHFGTFLDSARLFDHVFTTDIDSIRRYRAALGHDRVHLLPFACQPRIHNPVMAAPRQHGFCFAGSYYHQYPERCADFERLVSTLSALAPVVIHDRNSERNDPAFAFPGRYADMLRPALPYDRIDEAYKGYRFAINLTTIKQSQTMFARRVYELMACNTITVSNYSRGLRNLFGDLVIASDQPRTLERRLRPLLDDPGLMRRLRLQGLRKVLQQHTCDRRIEELAQRVLGQRPLSRQPLLVVVARVADAGEWQSVLAAYRRQNHAHRRLVLVAARGFEPGALPSDIQAGIVREQDSEDIDPAREWPDSHVAAFHPADHYGPDYLTDLALATLYSDAPCIGKGARFERSGRSLQLRHEDLRYRDASPLHPRACIARVDALDGDTLARWLDRVADSDGADDVSGLAIDEFNYCRDGVGIDAADVDGRIEDLDAGIDLDELQLAVDRVARAAPDAMAGPATRADVNDVRADFRAIAPRSDVLMIAGDGVDFSTMPGPVSGDRFRCLPSPSRSFCEQDGAEVMQGTITDLQELTGTACYRELWVKAPDVALCDLIRDHAAQLDIRVCVSAADIHEAGGHDDRGRAPWLALLEDGYPRIRAAVARQEDASLLEAMPGQPAGGRCIIVTDAASGSP